MARLSFLHSKFCRGQQPCPDRKIRQFDTERGIYYAVCKFNDTCNLKSDHPVKAAESLVYAGGYA